MTAVERGAACRSCGAPIRWAFTTTGRRMPVDREAHPDGNVRLVLDETALEVVAQVLGPLEVELAAGEELYRSHYVTCPDADAWRRS